MEKEPVAELFDWKLYGLLIRKARQDLGFTKAEEFAESILRRTHTRISRDTLYKIEQGRQVPDANQFMALNLAVGKSLFNPETSGMCVSQTWKSLSDGVGIPDEWKKENSETAWRRGTGMEGSDDLAHMPSGKSAVALLSETAHTLANDKPELFDTEVDDKWHDALRAYLSETYGPDMQDWPDPSDS